MYESEYTLFISGLVQKSGIWIDRVMKRSCESFHIQVIPFKELNSQHVLAFVQGRYDKKNMCNKKHLPLGEYIKNDAAQLLAVPRNHVRHGMRWGRGLNEILDAVDSEMAELRKAVVVISYADNDIYGQYGFVDCEYIENERACQSQARRDAMEALLNQRIQDHYAALERWPI